MEKTLISDNLLRISTPLLPISLSSLLSKRCTCFSPRFLGRKWRRITVRCSISAVPDPISPDYGGWDELEMINELSASGKVDPLRSFLVSVGIHDRKHAVIFGLGFFSALIVSRVRFSSLVVFPLSVLVFLVGFSAGSSPSGLIRGFWMNGGGLMMDSEKVKELGSFLDEMDAKISDLRIGLEGFISSDHLEMGKLKNYLEVVDYVGSEIGNARKNVESFIGSDFSNWILGSDGEGGKKLKQKSSRKRKELGEISLDFVQFFASMFQDNLVALKTPKRKDTAKGEAKEQQRVENNPVLTDTIRARIENNETEERVRNPVSSKDLDHKVEESGNVSERMQPRTQSNVQAAKALLDNGTSDKFNAMKTRKNSVKSGNGSCSDDMLSFDEQLNYLKRSSRVRTDQASYRKLVFQHRYEGLTTLDHDGGCVTRHRAPKRAIDYFAGHSEACSSIEEALQTYDTSHLHSYGTTSRKQSGKQIHNMNCEETRVQSEEWTALESRQPLQKMEEENMSSSELSADEEFDQLVKEASSLLKQARECLINRADEDEADMMLYRSATLLTTASSMNPMSLLAVGQLGNTYLLHGELKLRISRELRDLLSRTDDFSTGKGRQMWIKKLDTCHLNRDNVASVLVDVCEECEELLVESGRKYRVALTIDQNDVRALYNWGLALSFRAQLISDIGPEAAFDADKVYLAAIDKFDALTSRNNAYAPDALFRWGMALQQRSNLHHHDGREKVKLLQQAKSLFEDVLHVNSDHRQVREALSLCLLELNNKGRW